MIAASNLAPVVPPQTSARSLRLPGYSFFAGLLAAAGLPIYIHAPKYYVDEHSVSLVALGTALFVLRLLDFAQDPFLGWLSERLRHRRRSAVAAALALLAVSMLALFAVTPPVAPILWFALSLTGLDFVTSVSGAAAALANIGPGLGEIIGPAGNYASLNDTAKWILSIAMLIGRLELIAVYVIFTLSLKTISCSGFS